MCVNCIRFAGYGRDPDMVLIPTTRDEVGQFGRVLRGPYVSVEWCADGTRLWDVHVAFVRRHAVEEDVLVPTGLYIVRPDPNWGGAPIWTTLPPEAVQEVA